LRLSLAKSGMLRADQQTWPAQVGLSTSLAPSPADESCCSGANSGSCSRVSSDRRLSRTPGEGKAGAETVALDEPLATILTQRANSARARRLLAESFDDMRHLRRCPELRHP